MPKRYPPGKIINSFKEVEVLVSKRSTAGKEAKKLE